MPDPADVTESDIHDEFLHRGLDLVDTVMALQNIGYDYLQAEAMVAEWIDALEQDQDGETI